MKEKTSLSVSESRESGNKLTPRAKLEAHIQAELKLLQKRLPPNLFEQHKKKFDGLLSRFDTDFITLKTEVTNALSQIKQEVSQNTTVSE